MVPTLRHYLEKGVARSGGASRTGPRRAWQWLWLALDPWPQLASEGKLGILLAYSIIGSGHLPLMMPLLLLSLLSETLLVAVSFRKQRTKHTNNRSVATLAIIIVQVGPQTQSSCEVPFPLRASFNCLIVGRGPRAFSCQGFGCLLRI